MRKESFREKSNSNLSPDQIKKVNEDRRKSVHQEYVIQVKNLQAPSHQVQKPLVGSKFN